MEFKINSKYKPTGDQPEAIKYLSDILSAKQFKDLMSDFKKTSQLGDDIIQKTFSYYDEKLENKIVKKWIKIY